MSEEKNLILEDVSKFYGEVLGVNRIDLKIAPGITSLVGPNGSGKTTLMNLMTGLLNPTQGRIRIRGIPPSRPEELFELVGYCTQYDSFPRGMTGYSFLYSHLRLHALSAAECRTLALEALERVDLSAAGERKVAGYSKGMRQRIKLAQAISHRPAVLILDEPLNGLDPLARAEMIALFQELAAEGLHVVISSHILHEVDMISDQVILLNAGYVVAEGEIHGVREEMEERPLQVFVRCEKPQLLASRMFQEDHITEVKVHEDGRGLHLRTRNQESFYLLLNRIVVEDGVGLEAVGPADGDVHAVYRYLIEEDGDAK